MFRKLLIASASAASSLYTYYKSTTGTGSDVTETKPSDYQYELTQAEQTKLRNSSHKPKVVSLYDEYDGAANADLAIQHFENEGIEVVRVSPQEGLKHPIFKQKKISGIFLPGGSDVPVNDNADPRKKFEEDLINLANVSDIPLLGICRGEQAIGFHNGLNLNDLPEPDHHYDHYGAVARDTDNSDSNNKVVVNQGSLLYKALHREFKEIPEDAPIEYPVKCIHHQHLTETPGQSDSDVKVTARNPYDQSVEGIEKQTGTYYTMGYQHRPERVISHAEEVRKEKLAQLHEKVMDSLIFDPEYSSVLEFKEKRHILQKTKEERAARAARAELGLFSSQAKKKHLDEISKTSVEEMLGEDYMARKRYGNDAFA